MSQEFSIVGNLLLKVDGAEAGLNRLKNSLSKLEMPKGLENSFRKSFSNLDDIFARYKKQLEKGFDSKTDVSNITKIGKELDSELTKVSNHLTKLTGEKVDFKIDTAPVKQATKDLEDILEKRRQLVQEKLEFKIDSPKEGIDNIKQLLEEFRRVTGDTKAGRAVGNALFQLETGDIEKALSFLKEAENNLSRIGDKKKEAFSSTGFTFSGALETVIKELETTDGELATVSDKAKLFQDILAQAQAGQLKDVDALLEKISQGFTKNASSAREAAKATQDYAQSTVSMKDQVKQLQQSTQYFFSLRNMINLFKRGVREAVDTVKQLDAAMTETAVVTKFSVGDMWAKLPEYTANANALGATVQDMYESTTLYYQQGLNTQQAMGIATETMKMARIAGLEAAEATDMMTAALRGFNMEINEASAEHINDVYSNLAAKTASNTEELGTAMQRTASIAHSAGMSFEGTAAFLAQAIETTREPAENLGTAMKTIVARFQELKKNPLEITDVDGEEVSYNKVDTALKTIGVDLKDTNGQFRDLDKVFLDISQKWDGLSQTQQRYIATTAAGSRQQSRFIAMMSDYNRTMELMGYANNSAGASTTQFNKTLDSLEAKINKFQNAWKQFLMGIMNDSWTKKVVDAGTSVLNIVNKIIDTLSVGGKLKGVKSILSTLTAFTALKMAGRGANALIGGLGGMVDPKSSMLVGMRQGALGGRQAANAAQAQMIYQPIVNELRAIRQLQGQQLTQENRERIGAYDQYNRFKDSRAFLTGLTKGGKAFSLQDIQQSLFGLNANSQNILMRSNAGTAYTLTKGILGNYAGRKGYDKNIAAGIKNAERFWNTQRKSGANTWEEYFGAISDPKLLKQGIDKTIGNGKYNPAYEFLDRLDKEISIAASQNTSNSEVMDAFKARYKELAEAGAEDIGAQLRKEGWAEKIKAENQKQRQKIIQKDQGSFQNSNAARVLNTIGQVGAGFSQVGMGLQAFGSILTSSANPALQMFGTAINTIGGVISGIGMGISAISSGFTALATSSIMTAAETALAGKTLFGLSLTAGTLTGILGILVAAIAGVAFLIKKHRDDIKKDAEEITTKYKDKSSENQSNLANLRQWKSELAVLSKGVDENGYNISLDTADYEHYLEIVDSIAKINPEIVQGYNAQGHAIIDNNNALEKTLALEEQRSKTILKDYTSPDSLTKLLKARNLQRSRVAGGGAAGQPRIETIEYELKPRTNMRREAAKIGKELQKNKELVDLSKIDIDIDELAGGSEVEFQKVLNNYDLFKRLVSDSIDRAGDEWSDKSREAVEKSISSFEEYGSDLDELVQPVYEALSAAASQTSGFQEMASNLKIPFQNALKELATNGEFTDGKEIDKAAKNMATKFAGYSEAYIDAMDKVDRANKQFALDFNEREYDANTEDAINELETLKSTLEDTPEGHAISEWIGQEINKIQKHLSTGTKSIEEAWDTISDKITVAESSLDNFNKKTEKDFYSAADDMQKIYETVMDPEAYHTVGFGDNTFWAGAEALLGQNTIIDKNKDEVLDLIKNVEPFLKEGPEGVKNFADRVADLSKGLDGITGVEMDGGWFKSIDEDINPEAWAQIAEYMGISEELLISMVNKSRQFKQWDFSDMSAVREAYSIDESVIHGKKQSSVTTTDETGKETTVQADTLYITDAELRSRMGSDYYQKDRREAKTEELNKQGVEVLPEHLDQLTAQMMKNEMGIADWNEAIKTFGDTGAFDKSEIYEAAKILKEDELGRPLTSEEESNFQKEFSEGWTSWLESYENPLADPISTIAGDVAAIAGKVVGESSADKKENENKKDIDNKEPIETNSKENKTIPAIQKAEDHDRRANTQTDERNWIQKVNDWFVKAQENQTKNMNGANSDNTERTQRQNEFWNNITNKITESAKKQQEVQEAYTNVQSKAEESEQNKSEFWSKLLNTSVNDATGYTKETDATSDTQTNDNLTTGSEALTQAATQLTGGIESLGTAGESLNTAASNLTNAAAVLSTINQGNGTTSNGMPAGTSGPPAPNQQSSASGIVVVDNSPALASFEELQSKATEVKTQIETPMEVSLNVQDSGLSSVANKVKTINEGSGEKSINVTATASDPAPVDTLREAVEAYNKLDDDEVKLTTSLNGASVSSINKIMNAIDDFHTKGDHSVTLTVNYRTTGTKTEDHKATGAHNHGSFAAPPSFGSAAGGYGQVGPKGKGGLTLTGELGYEIAWLPSENRSMILGANGPQMVNLPGDAVVWTHEQSKKILKQKAIPAGSHDAKSKKEWNFSGWEDSGSGTKDKGKGTGKKDKGKKGKGKKGKGGKGSNTGTNDKKTINNFSIQEVIRFNIDQKLSKLADEIAKRTKEIEKSLEKIGVTYNEIIGSTKEQISALESVKNQNQQLISSYQKQLNDYRGRSAQISYTNSKGKPVNKTIKVGTYLNADGSINEDKIRSVKTRAEREAIYKEIQSAKSLTDGMSNAQKAIDDANEKIEELHKKVADTFFNWENEITWVYNLTQKLNNIQSLRDRFSEQINLELDKVATGFKTTADALNNINTVVKRDNQALLDQLEAQKQLIAARKLETEEAYSWADEAEELAYQYSQNADEGIIKSAQQNLDAATLMQNYIKGYSVREDGTVSYDIDWEKFAADKSNISTMGITKETYELIKKKLDTLNDATAEQNNAIREAASLEDQIFQNISDYQQTQVDLESSLLKGLEQQQEEEADNLKELGSVISDALSDLLDEVKYKLDMRRQQEDNLKTEADIMGKQRRLAMLRADTSGGNQVEIAQLEKEIADSQQDYQRTLEDQLLDKLQHQADEAAKQRERQIELLEVANEINNDNRELVRKWVENPSLYQSEITEVLKAAQGFEEAGYFEQAQILRDIGKQIVEGQYASTQLRKTDTSKEQQQLSEAEAQKAELETQAANVNQQIEAAQTRLMDAKHNIRSIDQELAKNSIDIGQKESRLRSLDLQKEYFNSPLRRNGPLARLALMDIDRERERLIQQLEEEKAKQQPLLEKRAYYTDQLKQEQETIRDLTKDGAYLQEKISTTGELITNTINTIYDISTSTLPGVIDLVNQFNAANLNIDPTYLNTHGQIVGSGYATREQGAWAALNTASSQYIARNTPTVTTSTTDTGNHAAAGGGTSTVTSYPYGKASQTSGRIQKGDSGKKVQAIQWALKQMGYKGSNGNALAIDGKFGGNTEHAVKSFQKAMKISQDGVVGDQTRKKFKAKGYKTGGLADYTGPAWLDGTPSKPELVLNAKDTANFIALKDVLAKAMNGIGDTSNTYGDISYEININVDKIEKDYDVDRVVEKVKKEIVKGAGYRNVTQVRSFR